MAIATLDFEGRDIEGRFKGIYEMATVQGFSFEKVPKLGCTPDTVADGCRMNDGSVVFTNLESILEETAITFEAEINGDIYKGQIHGLCSP